MIVDAATLSECINEPRGLNGLEGYQMGDTYVTNKVMSDDGVTYFRIYPCPGDYYETCSPSTFKKFFKRTGVR